MNANDRQEGGDHYAGSNYQHWDWVTDINLAYLPGNATKYLFRWRKKNGVEDLRKCLHYLDKCIEREVPPPMFINVEATERFIDVNGIKDHVEWMSLIDIHMGQYPTARARVEALIAGAERAPH